MEDKRAKIRRIVYAIMNKDRTLIAKGSEKGRYLIKIKNRKDKRRIITYSSRKTAENSLDLEYENLSNIPCTNDDLEVVECYLSLYER